MVDRVWDLLMDAVRVVSVAFAPRSDRAVFVELAPGEDVGLAIRICTGAGFKVENVGDGVLIVDEIVRRARATPAPATLPVAA